jgi:hypothetical protein
MCRLWRARPQAEAGKVAPGMLASDLPVSAAVYRVMMVVVR